MTNNQITPVVCVALARNQNPLGVVAQRVHFCAEKAMPRVFLHPGFVISKNDGQRHFVSAMRLAELYGVSMTDCIVVSDRNPMHGIVEQEDDVHLHPRYDGNYPCAHPSGPPRVKLTLVLPNGVSQ